MLERHLHLEHSKPLKLYKHFWTQSSCHCRTGAPRFTKRLRSVFVSKWYMLCNLLIHAHQKCIVQTDSVHPSWFGYVVNGSLFWLWLRFDKLLSQLMIWDILWYELMKFEKRRWCGATHNLHSREVLSEVLVTHVASAIFARCLVLLEKSLGLTFTNVFGASEALVSVF